jgi:Zn finger protein HypA/HybF involved in hydrogenase expression
MHEFHLTQTLLQTALDKATLQDSEQIERLHIALDPDSTYLADAIRFYFEQLAQNTAAADAQLEFNTTTVSEQIRLTSIDIGLRKLAS